jgi:hypothetical protein
VCRILTEGLTSRDGKKLPEYLSQLIILHIYNLNEEDKQRERERKGQKEKTQER